MAVSNDEELARHLVEVYSNRLLRVAYSLLGSVSDAQDVCQEVFIKRLAYSQDFESEEHEKAWLIRVTVNVCKNMLRNPWRSRVQPLEQVSEQPVFQPEEGGMLEAMLGLSAKEREVLVLYYYIGYDTNEIGSLLHIRAEAVRTRMKRARQKLKGILEGDWNETHSDRIR